MPNKNIDLFEKKLSVNTQCYNCLDATIKHISPYCFKCFDKKTYMDFRNENVNYAFEAKKYWQMIYDENAVYLDKNFSTEFPEAFYSRIWELTILKYLHRYNSKGIKLIVQTGKGSKTDFCFKIDDNPFYVENICVNPSKKPLYNIKNINGLNFKISVSEKLSDSNASYKESLSSAIKLKGITKFNSGYKKHISQNGLGGLILCISMAKFVLSERPVDCAMAALSCIFPISEIPQVSIIADKNNRLGMQEPHYIYQSCFTKSSNAATIKTDYFFNKQFNYISAIIISHSDCTFFPDVENYQLCNWEGRKGEARNDFLLIHNPFAKFPLPKGFFSVQEEVESKIDGNNCKIIKKFFKDK